MFPNLVHHKTQGEAALEVHQFYPLVLTNCSSYLTLFLCSLYAPICTILNRPLPPCRGLCNRVKNGCLPLLQKFGFSWPESMACKKFPERNGLGICVDLATIAAVTTQPPRPTDGKISVNNIWNKWYMNCGNEMNHGNIWNHNWVLHVSYKHTFNLRSGILFFQPNAEVCGRPKRKKDHLIAG